MPSLPAPDVYDRFLDCSLPKSQWTHEAHLVVCWSTLQRLDEKSAVHDLRRRIKKYNVSVGTANTDSGGYHETLTTFYVMAVAHVGALIAVDLFHHQHCSRDSVLAYWSREVLFSTAARLDWVAPNLEPLPWPSMP